MEQVMFNSDMESISAQDQEKMEASLLLEQIEYTYEHSKMYKDTMSRPGLERKGPRWPCVLNAKAWPRAHRAKGQTKRFPRQDISAWRIFRR